MDIAFTGTKNHAASCTLTQINMQPAVAHTLTCTLDNEGKKKHLYDFSQILEEFPHLKNPAKNNVITVSVLNKINLSDIFEINKGLSDFLKNKYNPQGDMVIINGKQLVVGKNKLYIVKKLQELVGEISEKKEMELFLAREGLDKAAYLESTLGLDLVQKEASPELIKQFFKKETIDLNANGMIKSFQNLIKRIR